MTYYTRAKQNLGSITMAKDMMIYYDKSRSVFHNFLSKKLNKVNENIWHL